MRVLLALFAALLLLSVGSGATASTSTPPQNGLIAVSSPEGIYVVDPSAGTAKLVPKTADMTNPAWSPDGTVLAASSLDDQGFDDLYTMKPDGSERRLVLADVHIRRPGHPTGSSSLSCERARRKVSPTATSWRSSTLMGAGCARSTWALRCSRRLNGPPTGSRLRSSRG